MWLQGNAFLYLYPKLKSLLCCSRSNCGLILSVSGLCSHSFASTSGRAIQSQEVHASFKTASLPCPFVPIGQLCSSYIAPAPSTFLILRISPSKLQHLQQVLATLESLPNSCRQQLCQLWSSSLLHTLLILPILRESLSSGPEFRTTCLLDMVVPVWLLHCSVWI